MSVATTTQTPAREYRKVGRIDCDVHPYVRSRADLKPYLASRFHPYLDQVAGRELYTAIPVGARPNRSFHREDAFPPAGGPPGSDLAFMREQLLDPYGISRAILLPLDNIGIPAYGDFGAAVTDAINEWLVAEWLDEDPRFYGSVVIPVNDAERAIDVIARAAKDPRFVQVLVLVPTSDPLGHPRYRPILRAAAERGLPVSLHPGGFSGAISGTGYPTYFFELHVGLPFTYAAQVVSLVYSGVFDELPNLQIVVQEGGISWMVPLLARLDRTFLGMRDQQPHLTALPSTTVRRHFAFSTQPLEEPIDPLHLLKMFDQLDMDDRIMFASDYPHWDFDSPERALPGVMPPEMRAKVFEGNALSFYRFEPSVS
jgi:predicted TIM-barrel fold metal-dependent hydrolase